MRWSSATIGSMRRVATIATMASRVETFRKVLPVIHAQVDHVSVYLDGYTAPPAFLENVDRITVRRAGDLHASSRFLSLRDLNSPTVVVIVDDDIIYPSDYVDRLVAALQRFEGEAVVGVFGRVFFPPHESYVRDARAAHFEAELPHYQFVHELGTGTCAFVSSNLEIDPTEWGRYDMDDINVAIEAQRRRLPRIAVARQRGWLKAHSERQPDSLWVKAKADDSEHSRRMRTLLGLYV